MNDLDNNAIDRLLAKFMGWSVFADHESYLKSMYGITRSPTTNRNDLAEVLGKLTQDQWEAVMFNLRHTVPPMDTPAWCYWVLTCDPSIIARAVAEVVR